MVFAVVGGGQLDTGGFQIDNSLRFNEADQPRLSRTPASTSGDQTFTLSFWLKRNAVDDSRDIVLFEARPAAGTYFILSFRRSGVADKDRFYVEANTTTDLIFAPLFRDVSAWYHIVVAIDTTQGTSTNRVKFYVNGSQITDLGGSTTYPALNESFQWNKNVIQSIASSFDPSNLGSDYQLAEVHNISGQQLSPTDFGEFDEDSGIWKPIRYSGSYGTNGFHLDFADSSSLGNDVSGNNNNFTTTNLASTDQMLDTPINNFCTLNALTPVVTHTLSEGNLKSTNSSGTHGGTTATINYPTSGKWYHEVRINAEDSSKGQGVGIGNQIYRNVTNWGDYINFVAYLSDGTKHIDTGYSSYGVAHNVGDIIGVAYNADDQELTFYHDNSSQGTIPTSEMDGVLDFDNLCPIVFGRDMGQTFNFGQDSSFAGAETRQNNSDENGYGDFYYTPPSGYLALCTQNLATELSPTIDDGSQYFNTVLYTGNGGTNRSITGMGFQADLLWHKGRNATSPNHYHSLVDSTRGTNASIASNRNDGEKAMPSFVSFDSDGFTITQDVSTNPNWNEAGNTKVVWGWKANGGTTSSNTDGSITSTVQANTTAGFSIVLYTGNATTNATIGHGLGKPPKFVIVKMRNNLRDWPCLTTALDGTLDNIIFNRASSKSNVANVDLPTSSVFSMFSGNLGNGLGEPYVAYCFAEIEGYSKLDSYIGNGSTDGTFIYTGFRPAFVITKATVSNLTRNWAMYDTSRDTFNVTSKRLLGNTFGAETSNSFTEIDILSNGFKARTTGENVNYLGIGYIYMAFAENPFVTSTGIPVTAR